MYDEFQFHAGNGHQGPGVPTALDDWKGRSPDKPQTYVLSGARNGASRQVTSTSTLRNKLSESFTLMAIRARDRECH